MGEVTAISWCDHTFNPWVGCMKVSAGCTNCYAETLMERFGRPGLWGPNSRRQRTTNGNWRKPLGWNDRAVAAGVRRRVFSASLADIFEDHPTVAPWRADLFDLIRRTPALDWLLLTKRPEHLADLLPADWGQGYPNVWLGTSVENASTVERADTLAEVPAVVRFISAEPLLGPLDAMALDGIDWVITGGESGNGHRPMDLDWVRAIRDRCAARGVAFFHKQIAAPKPGVGTVLDGRQHHAWPVARQLVPG